MDSLKCPITCELFRDPVTGQDGHTYERDAITNWLQTNATSPITREPMTIDSLRPNYIVKKMIDEFTSTSLQKDYQFQLDIDIRKTKRRPLFQAPGKAIYEAEWISKPGPPIVLLRIDGAKARREASFYVQLGCHPHIVRTYGMLENDSNALTLVQEYATEGDLSELLRENEFQPSIPVLLEIFVQIIDAMICLADNGIVHGDLACRNVLVFRFNNSDPQENLVKLTDFGLTRASTLYSVVDSTASATLITIPLRYAAPEILQSTDISNYSEKSDVYSMGVLMWEVCSSGQIPYASIDNENEVRRLKINGEILTRPDKCDEALWNIIIRCWHQQANARPTFRNLKQSLLELQFRQGSNSTDVQNNQKPIRENYAGQPFKHSPSLSTLPAHSNYNRNTQETASTLITQSNFDQNNQPSSSRVITSSTTVENDNRQQTPVRGRFRRPAVENDNQQQTTFRGSFRRPPVENDNQQQIPMWGRFRDPAAEGENQQQTPFRSRFRRPPVEDDNQQQTPVRGRFRRPPVENDNQQQIPMRGRFRDPAVEGENQQQTPVRSRLRRPAVEDDNQQQTTFRGRLRRPPVENDNQQQIPMRGRFRDPAVEGENQQQTPVRSRLRRPAVEDDNQQQTTFRGRLRRPPVENDNQQQIPMWGRFRDPAVEGENQQQTPFRSRFRRPPVEDDNQQQTPVRGRFRRPPVENDNQQQIPMRGKFRDLTVEDDD